MTSPNLFLPVLTSAQITNYLTLINTGGLPAAIVVYQALYDQGYRYAGWALGVATGNTVTGQAALDYLNGTALMGLAGQACRNLSQGQIDQIRLDMAKGYLETLQQIASRNGDLLGRDVNYAETRNFHENVLTANGLTLDNWTLNTPMEVLRLLYGDAYVEQRWQELRDTGGDGWDAVIESVELLVQMYWAALQGNSAMQKMINQWLSDTPGLNMKGLELLSNFLKGLGGTSGDPGTGLPWPGTPDPDDWGTGFDGAQNTTSPIVLDLNGDGVKTTKLSRSFTAGVHFNLDAKGFAENTGWVDAQDGLLVRDLDGNGKITSGRELFGNHTLLTQGAKAGKEAANGFEALKELDGNNDGEVNASDAAFATLRVWKDANGNGATDAGELLTLAQAGVKSLKVAYTNNAQATADAQGNTAQQTGSYTTTDGVNRDMSDVWFAVDSARTQETDLVTVSDTIAALPDLAHMGNLHSLHQAMARDASGQLQTLVARYQAEALSPTRDALLQDILYHWAGVQDVDPASWAATQIYGNVIGDARKLAFLEALVGRDFLGTWCWGERDPNPHGPAAAKLLALYENVKTFYGAQLDAQTVCQDDLAALRLSWDEGTQSFGWDASHVAAQLRTEYESQPDQALQHVARLGQVFKQMGSSGEPLLQALQAQGDANGDALAQALFQAGSEQLIFTGTTVADKLVGNSANNHFHALATKFRCRSRAHLQRTTKLNVRH